jgi:predicted AlkP superfamily phosphohydrolase/phosphomutase
MMRVLVVGLDGASPYLIEKWRGDLPNLNEFMKNGVFGILESSHPPNTVPAWLCFATGKNPAKLGIFDFVKYTSNGEVRVVDSTLNDSQSIWEILSERGKKVGILNVPGTYPPTSVNGFMVAGVLTPLSRRNYTYPTSLLVELDELVGGYETDIMVTSPRLMRGGESAFLSEVERMHNKRVEATKYLVDSFSWHFFMVVYRAIDIVQHHFWHYMDDRHPKYTKEGAKKFGDIIKRWYCKLDSTLGELFERIDDETTIILMSDHGCGPVDSVFYINEWLRQKGFLSTIEPKVLGSSVKLDLLLAAKRMILKYISPRALKKIVKQVPSSVLLEVSLRGEHRTLLTEIFKNTDWSSTKVYALGGQLPAAQIHINAPLNSRNYRKWKRQLLIELENLSKYRDIELQIYMKNDIYSGEYLDIAPDLSVYMIKDSLHCETDAKLMPGMVWGRHSLSGGHNMEGLLAMKGPYVKANYGVKAKIVDLAPTILHLMGFEISVGMDGRVLTSFLKEKKPVKYTNVKRKRRILHTFSNEDEKEIMERLKQLGYL